MPTFTPVVFPHAEVVVKLQLVLYRYQLCFFLTGTYALYVGGRLNLFDGLTIFVALNDFDVSPVLLWIFKKVESPGVTEFVLDIDLVFTLLNADNEHEDLSQYQITIQVSFLELIPPNVAGPSPTLIWFTLRGAITSNLAIRNTPWPSHLEAPIRPDCCF
jgi:hypothetical protein